MSRALATTDDLAAQLGPGYAHFDAAERERHLALLAAIARPQDVALHAEPGPGGRWTVTVCTADSLGALSVIAGLFSAYRFDILGADIYTVRTATESAPPATTRRRWSYGSRRPPLPPAAPRRKTLDIFEVRALESPPPNLWQHFRDELADLMALLVGGQHEAARERLIDRVSQAARGLGAHETHLPPMTIDIRNDESSPFTELFVRSADTWGFLFAFTNALAGFMINIECATVRTVRGEACDTFWVTDLQGQKIVRPERVHELRVATALIKQFTHLLPRSADPGQALRQFTALIRQLLARPDWPAELHNLESAAVLEMLADVMGVSRFLWEDFLRLQHENLFPILVDPPALQAQRSKEQLRADLAERLRSLPDHDGRVAALNHFKDREMFRIDLRHLTGRIAFEDFSRELTALAEVVVEAAASLADEALGARYGAPLLADGRRCPLVICALGKFGGAELGFGSDLELLFVYEDEGTTAGPVAIPNSQYFGHVVQTFRAAIRARQEGIFEIDLRLRPYGRAGPLASTIDGFATYYSEHGAAEQFERMALVKLRPVAGDAALGDRVLRTRDAFVYSGKPLDLGNIQHLRHRQATELVPRGQTSAKYSPGGLVDVEYFVQARQILAGYRDPSVRVTNTLDAIARLAAGGHLDANHAEDLRACYRFLRRLIDALRVVRGNAKDLTIPPVETRDFAYLAHRLHYSSAAELHDTIVERMAFARSLWDRAGADNHAEHR
jgi:glutamate-ammonia-ligase adenylyltransferase